MQCATLTEQQGWFDGSWELQRRRTDKGPAVGAEGARADDEHGGNGELHLDCIYLWKTCWLREGLLTVSQLGWKRCEPKRKHENGKGGSRIARFVITVTHLQRKVR